ncbi:cupin domain-containing protein [Halomonas sp. HP20-15]|uniref:cupin domain-containing protein n=1 Tax=Halomonas sp. HP20-15 TaxID=3085901 RepID=UPI0029818A0D|nr:cupin domain-containing protein [Halomonas sp. HP20-15]MDW5375646.1 cupin domain-containing protein [Halomonas sp. HP20-15]
MTASRFPVAIDAEDISPRSKPSNYPEPYASRMAGRIKRQLGDAFGLENFGVNLVRLAPGAMSALRHAHALQDEFIYILSGHPTLITDRGETPLKPGMCAGFRHATADGHHLVNATDEDVVYLEVGDRTPNDTVTYPDDDLCAVKDPSGQWRFARKDGSHYAR